MKKQIGLFEAKTHFSWLVDRVNRGESLTITRHGRPVARLVPIQQQDQLQARQAADRILTRRSRLKTTTVKQLIRTIHEGHRY